jgi:predicted porin
VFSSFGGGNQLQKLDLSLGLEYWYQDQFAVRAGYFYEDKTNGDRQYITAGLGVKYNVFQINAAYIVPQGSGTTRNPLSNTVRFSLLFEFDKLNKPAEEAPADVAPPSTN